MRALALAERWLPILAAVGLLAVLGDIWLARVAYPFDLEWMEGGMLAHAWRLVEGLPLYVPPGPDFAPFIYPPGYAAVVAALGSVVGLSPMLGRLVSLAGILAAAAALGFGVRQQGGSWPITLGAAAVFLGTYPSAGAYFDIVRPDSLALGLASWSIVLALQEERWAPVASGGLLAAAFLCKHNFALLGVPLVIGLGVRDWRAAARFAAASMGPALAVVGWLQWSSGGHFLTYLLEVPRSHNYISSRATIDTWLEVGTALPFVLGAIGWGLFLPGVEAARRWPRWLVVTVPLWLGVGVAWAGTYVPPPPDSRLSSLGAAIAYWAVVVGIAGPLLRLLGRRWWSARAVLGLGVGLVALGMSLLMRAHDGGFVNVHMPLFWVCSFGFGVLLTRWSRHPGTPPMRALITGLLVAQLAYAAGRVDRSRYVPTEADVAAGWAFVERARPIEGPILSPFAAWLPVYAGKPPSIHAMALWDCNYPDGPYVDDLRRVRDALRADHWPLAFGGNHYFVGPLTADYEPLEVLVEEGGPVFLPKTGFRAHPWRTMVPIVGQE